MQVQDIAQQRCVHPSCVDGPPLEAVLDSEQARDVERPRKRCLTDCHDEHASPEV